MGKKHSKIAKALNRITQARKQGDIASLLNQAWQTFKSGNYPLTIKLGQEIEEIAQAADLENVHLLLAESYFRAAFEGNRLARPEYLDLAAKISPDATHIVFWQTIAQGSTGDIGALEERLAQIAQNQPARKGINYLYQLSRLANGQQLQNTGLTTEESNTLQIVANILQKQDINPEINNATSSSLSTTSSNLLGRSEKLWPIFSQLKKQQSISPELFKSALSDSNNKIINGILEYYRGVMALEKGDIELAREAWSRAERAGYESRWFSENSAALKNNSLKILASEQKWQEIINLTINAKSLSDDDETTEIIGLALFQVGYQAAEAGEWPKAASHWRRLAKINQSCRLAQNLALAEEALENWEEAADSWREMLRRRSRKEGNANYLDTNQVVAIWKRAANCYQRDENLDEAITCLKTAMKYAKGNAALRIEVADALMENGQEKAATNELQRIVADHPENIDALVRLSQTYLNDLEVDRALELCQKAFKIDAKNELAQEGLVAAYIKKADAAHPQSKEVAIIEEALKILPKNVALILRLAEGYRDNYKEEKAVELYLQACELSPNNVKVLGESLHELLHFKTGKDAATRIMNELSRIKELPAEFWISQGHSAITCNLDLQWVQKLYDEALTKVDSELQKATKADILSNIFLSLNENTKPGQEINKDVAQLSAHYAQRIKQEVPKSGAVEFMEAFQAFRNRQDKKEAKRLLGEAKRKARLANEQELLAQIEDIILLVDRGGMGMGMPVEALMRLMEKYPNGPPKNMSPRDMMDIMSMLGGLPDEFFEDED